MNFTKITKGLTIGAVSVLMSTAAFAEEMTPAFCRRFSN